VSNEEPDCGVSGEVPEQMRMRGAARCIPADFVASSAGGLVVGQT